MALVFFFFFFLVFLFSQSHLQEIAECHICAWSSVVRLNPSHAFVLGYQIYQTNRKEKRKQMLFLNRVLLHCNAGGAVRDIVGEVNEKLCEAALGCCVITKNRGESGIPKRFGKTLTQGLSGSAVVTQAEGGQYGL